MTMFHIIRLLFDGSKTTMVLLSSMMLLLLLKSLANGQVFQPVDNSYATEAVADFVVNREKFPSYCCAGTVDYAYASTRDEKNVTLNTIWFSNCEDAPKKKSRADWSRASYREEEERNGWATLFGDKGKTRLFAEGKEVNDEMKGPLLHGDWQPKDPWSWSIIDMSSLRKKREDGLFWLQVFQDEKLLWAEDNGLILRGEWSVGPDCRVQCYFDKKFGGLPSYCRYIWPIDLKAKFGKKSKAFVNEIETMWAKKDDGWVPTKVRNYREKFDKAGMIVSTEEFTMEIKWDSQLCNEGTVAAAVFEEGKITPEALFKMFKAGETAKASESK